MLDGFFQMTIYGILDTTLTSFDYDLRSRIKLLALVFQPLEPLASYTGTQLQSGPPDP
jgi:hypothetical protein